MSIRAMPSPRGTNREKRFIVDRSGAAYDAALTDEAALELLEFLRGKLSDRDLDEFCRLARIDAGEAMDDEHELEKRMPRPTTNEQAQDQARARLAARVARQPVAVQKSYAERWPNAAKIKVW